MRPGSPGHGSGDSGTGDGNDISNNYASQRHSRPPRGRPGPRPGWRRSCCSSWGLFAYGSRQNLTPSDQEGGLRMRFPHRRAKAAGSPADYRAAGYGPPRLAERSCCCLARPVVRVLLPANAARPHSIDLLLCGHHYLASRAALAVANAVAIDETGAVLDLVQPPQVNGVFAADSTMIRLPEE